MKRVLCICLVAFAAALIAACNGAVSNPAAPDTANLSVGVDASNLTAATAEVRSNYNKVRHDNPNEDDGDPLWVVVAVNSNGSAVSKHCDNHREFITSPVEVCDDCDLSGYEVGVDCSACGNQASVLRRLLTRLAGGSRPRAACCRWWL